MLKSEKKPLPVLLGADLNAYSVAYAFYSAYGVKSHIFARDKLAPVAYSAFTVLHVVEELDDVDVAVKHLIEFSREHKNDELILIPCADWYTEMLEYARDKLVGHFYFVIPPFEIWRMASDKASFYRTLEKYGISYPKTVFISSIDECRKPLSHLKPPFVVKAADSSEYWRHRFQNMKKVYFTEDLSESFHIAERILCSGYSGRIILQERIGNDKEPPKPSVLTTYSNKNGRVIRALLGDVLLEEKGPTATGNYSAIVTRSPDGFCKGLIDMLNSIGYVGFANFDILYFRDKAYCLELNPRQGRSCDYLRAGGINIAELIRAELEGVKLSARFLSREALWLAVPFRVVKRHAVNKQLLEYAKNLYEAGEVYSLLDLREESPKRKAYNLVHGIRQEILYKKLERGQA